MMDQPLGRVVALQYRSVGQMLTGSVLRVHIRTHMDTYEYTDLPNTHWRLENPALQFLALQGYRPSDLDGTMHDAKPEQILLPIAPDPPDSWGLGANALEGGKEALEEAEWFDGGSMSDGANPDSAPPGGAEPDPGTGNRAGVDIEQDEEGDSGITVKVT